MNDAIATNPLIELKDCFEKAKFSFSMPNIILKFNKRQDFSNVIKLLKPEFEIIVSKNNFDGFIIKSKENNTEMLISNPEWKFKEYIQLLNSDKGSLFFGYPINNEIIPPEYICPIKIIQF